MNVDPDTALTAFSFVVSVLLWALVTSGGTVNQDQDE